MGAVPLLMKQNSSDWHKSACSSVDKNYLVTSPTCKHI